MTRLLGGVCLVLLACRPAAPRNVADELPQLVSDPIPFRYPSSLYEQRVEGEVTLRIHVDSSGRVVPESLKIAEPSGYAELDRAAVEGAPQMLFRPALFRGRKVPLTVLFPVKFRVPAAVKTQSDTGEGPDR